MSEKTYRDYVQEADDEAVERAAQRAAGSTEPLHDIEYLKRPATLPNTLTRKEAKALALSRGMNPPDYAAGTGLLGTNMVDHPAPYIRKFPNSTRKRRVHVKSMIYYGLGTHYYTSMREEDNPIWSMDPNPAFRREDAKGGWVSPHDDPDRHGINVSERCTSKLDADRWIRKSFEELFNVKTHVLVDEYSEKRWFYRDGD